MLSFECDYNKGAHPEILRKLVETNDAALPGYGSDEYCESAKKKIVEYLACPEAEVHFLVGGTQTNQIVIDSLLKGYEGVIAADTGHVSGHEAGAIESTGHKVLTISHEEGKLTAAAVEQYLKDFYHDGNHEHMVFPGMVYISFPTEYGTIYSHQEMKELYAVCREYEIPLFVDGARLGYALACEACDLTMQELARCCDVFYIGGTKVGALCGEAVVFTHKNTPKHFITITKRRGGLLAKGRLLGVQFDTLFTDGMYLKIAGHAMEMAEKMKRIFREKGYEFFLESPTNQIFIVLDNDKKAELDRQVRMGFWEKADESHTVVRLAASWATTEEEVAELERLL